MAEECDRQCVLSGGKSYALEHDAYRGLKLLAQTMKVAERVWNDIFTENEHGCNAFGLFQVEA